MVTGLILRNVTHSNEWAAVTGNLSVDISAIMQTLQRFYSGSLTAVVLGPGFLQTKRRSGSISFLSVSPFAMREKKKGCRHSAASQRVVDGNKRRQHMQMSAS